MNDKPNNDADPTADERTALPATDVGGHPVPDRVLIAPWGVVDSTNGRFVVDAESARRVKEAFAAHATDLPIDYEHQTLGGRFSSPSGQAPAAGWIKEIAVEPGVGLYAVVSWTESARDQLVGGQYRYLSPVAIVRKADRKLLAIHSVALTNKPAIVGMRPIFNRHVDDPADDTEEILVALREQLALAATTPPHEVLSAAHHRITELEQHARQRDAEVRVETAAQEGKLTDAQRAWARELAASDEHLFEQWLATAPVVVVPGRTEPPPPAPAGAKTEAAARSEYRANPQLHNLTSEDAFVADAVRAEAATT